MPNLRVCCAVAFAAFACAPATTRAQVSVQTTPPLAPGDTLRVWATVPRLNGSIGALTRLDAQELAISDLVTLGSISFGQSVVPLGSLRRLDVRRGTHRSGTRIAVGTALGIAGGVLIGGFIGPLVEEAFYENDSSLQGLVGLVFGAGIGGVAGGITGGVIGARRRPRWEPVSFSRRP